MVAASNAEVVDYLASFYGLPPQPSLQRQASRQANGDQQGAASYGDGADDDAADGASDAGVAWQQELQGGPPSKRPRHHRLPQHHTHAVSAEEVLQRGAGTPPTPPMTHLLPS